jgi:hypothetical protein
MALVDYVIPESAYSSMAPLASRTQEQVLPGIIKFGNGGTRYGKDGPGVKTVKTKVQYKNN